MKPWLNLMGSVPAKSTRLSLEKRIWVIPEWLQTVDSIVHVKTLCDLLDSWFIFVCPIFLF